MAPRPKLLWRQRNHSCFHKLFEGRVSGIPSFTKTPPPAEPCGDEADQETLIRISRERYAKSFEQTDRHIARLLETHRTLVK